MCLITSGVALPLLQQSMMFWQIGLGYLLLGRKLAPIQVSRYIAAFEFNDSPSLMPHLLVFPNQFQALECVS